jgi:hypothetical protein
MAMSITSVFYGVKVHAGMPAMETPEVRIGSSVVCRMHHNKGVNWDDVAVHVKPRSWKAHRANQYRSAEVSAKVVMSGLVAVSAAL